MLKLDTVRGKDSTGVIVVNEVNKKRNIKWDKSTGTPWDFFEKSKLFSHKGALTGFASALIGHNRAATAGHVNVENAHPFDFENVIGVHNGTLQYGSRDLEKWHDHDVDSAALYETINEHGLEDAIGKAQGAWSLAYYDKQEEAVVLIRNDERPMTYRMSEDQKTVFFASEAWMIKVACKKYNIKLAKHTYKTNVNTKYSIYPFEKDEDGTIKFSYQKEEIEGKKPVPPAYLGGNGGTGNNHYWRGRQQSSYSGMGGNSDYSNNHRAIFGKRNNQDLVKKIFDLKQPVHVYYPTDKNKINKTDSSITCYTVGTDIPVRVRVALNDVRRQKFMEHKPGECYTVVPNTMLLTSEETWITAQGNSLKGPIDRKDVVPITLDDEKKKEVKKATEATFAYGFDNVIIQKRDWQTKIDHCCVWCGGNDTTFEERGEIQWVSGIDYLCKDCKDLPELTEYFQDFAIGGANYGKC